jgi:hypothetical protein
MDQKIASRLSPTAGVKLRAIAKWRQKTRLMSVENARLEP